MVNFQIQNIAKPTDKLTVHVDRLTLVPPRKPELLQNAAQNDTDVNSTLQSGNPFDSNDIFSDSFPDVVTPNLYSGDKQYHFDSKAAPRGGAVEYSMAGGAGRRNILRELTSLDEGGMRMPNNVWPLTPPSPDESVIQLRGYHRKSATYNYDAADPVFFKTPTKSPKKSIFLHCTPTKLTPIRSSPRKKLNLVTPSKLKQHEGNGLKLHNMNHTVNIEKNIKALSHAQLVQLIQDAAKVSPNIKEILGSLVPVPDLGPVEERLHVLQRNVLKSFPRNIWGNQDGSFCFLRVRANLEAFKKECLEYCRQFMDSQHWPSVFEYILIAWKLALGLPDWSTAAHNKIKSSCIKYLATQCVNAFKRSKIDATSLNEIVQRMEKLGDDLEIKTCVSYAKDLFKYDS